MTEDTARTDFLGYLNEVYNQTNEHLREQGTKRDQVIAFYVVLLSFMITSGSLLAKTANMTIIYVGLIGVGAICVRTIADLRSWHQQYLDEIAVINWIKANQAHYLTVQALKNAIQFRVQANPKGPYKISRKSTDNGIYFGMVILTALPVLFVVKDFHANVWVTAVIVVLYLVIAMYLAAQYLVKTVTAGLRYPTWNLLFDYPVGNTTEPIFANDYMGVQVNSKAELHVTQKTGGVVALVHHADSFVLLRIRRQGALYWEIPRGFREKTDPDGFQAAIREVSEELGLKLKEKKKGEPIKPFELQDYQVQSRALGTIMPDSNLLTTDIIMVDLQLDPLTEKISVNLEAQEGIEDYQLKSLKELQAMIGSGEIVDGFTIAAVARYASVDKSHR